MGPIHIDSILFSYRVSRHDSTRYSPFFLVYGKNARLPVDFNMMPKKVSEIEGDDANELTDIANEEDGNDEEMNSEENENKDDGEEVDNEDKDDGEEESGENANKCDDDGMNLSFEEHVNIMIGVRRKALANIGIAQERQKFYYNAKHCKDKDKYVVGAAVLLKNSKKLSRKGSKMEPNWTGPYHIHEGTGKNTYKLCRFKGTNKEKVLKTRVNVTRLKLYHCTEQEVGKQNFFSAQSIMYAGYSGPTTSP